MKTKILKTSTAIIAALFLFNSALNAENQWESVKNDNGIEVFTRPVPGAAIKEFLAVTVVQSRLSSVLALLDDTSSYTKWIYRCSEASVLLKKNEYERITYSVTALPWPVDPRDIAVKSITSQNKKTGAITVSLTGLPGYIPVKSGRVRMVKLNGYWKFEPLGNGRVRVTYSLHSDPGGSLPESLVNSSLIDMPYNTMYNMKRMVLQSPYKDAKIKDIIEK